VARTDDIASSRAERTSGERTFGLGCFELGSGLDPVAVAAESLRSTRNAIRGPRMASRSRCRCARRSFTCGAHWRGDRAIVSPRARSRRSARTTHVSRAAGESARAERARCTMSCDAAVPAFAPGRMTRDGPEPPFAGKPWAPALSDRRPLSQQPPGFPGSSYSTMCLLASFITSVLASVVKWATTFCWFGCDEAVCAGRSCQPPAPHTCMSPVV